MRPSCLAFTLALAASSALAQPATQPAPWDTFSDTWVATDALGRTLPTAAEAPAPRAGRTVGIFYFLWLGQHGRAVYDISQLLAENPADPKYGPPGAFHWWGQSIFGYYLSDDALVIRKHAQMLTDAGVDVLIFDVTNAFTYPSVYPALCQVFRELRQTGQATPQIAFIAHSSEGKTVQKLYDDLYAKNLYPELWFRWQGKPLVLAKPEALSPALREFFTVRESWAWSNPKGWFGDGKDKWTWVDHHPQKPGWHQRPDKPEQISVSVAQHPVSNIGRSFHAGKQPPPDQIAPEKGLCFAEQWRRALEVDPQFVFITGWNEWVAQRFVSEKGGQPFLGKPAPKGGTFFVDQYNQEFSRDIEPMKGGHGDNYYYQMIDGIRRYKGVRPLPPISARPITLDGRFDDWRDVTPEFRDTLGDPVRRNHPGWDKVGPYVNQSGRNDLVAAKVSYDAQRVYFYVRTRAPLTPSTDPNWMLLCIDADHNPKTGWLGYDLVVNRTNVRATTTTLERHEDGTARWGKPGDIEYRAAGCELELAIPRAALGLTTLPATLDFKWVDNVPPTGDAADFTLHGDAAPNDRFNYRAVLPR